ncbi:MAG: 3,4-dihydroxy-2-butanone-4-phosphate synthase [Promethearchaeota archaeon]
MDVFIFLDYFLNTEIRRALIMAKYQINNMKRELGNACRALREGKPVLVFDREDREAEIDMVVAATEISPKLVYQLRLDAGGLICVAVHPKIAKKLNLPFLAELFKRNYEQFPLLERLEGHDIPYGEKSSFSLTINHRKTFTGITDNDRALTISEFAKLGRSVYQNGISPEKGRIEFGENFRSPGHVFLLRGADGLLQKRKGHTELTIVLANMAGITPVTTICEMMDGETGKALSLEKAKEYAIRHSLPIINSELIFEEFLKTSEE